MATQKDSEIQMVLQMRKAGKSNKEIKKAIKASRPKGTGGFDAKKGVRGVIDSYKRLGGRIKNAGTTTLEVGKSGFEFGRSGAEDVVGAVTGKPTFDPRTKKFEETPKDFFGRLGQAGQGVAKTIAGATETVLSPLAAPIGFAQPEVGNVVQKVWESRSPEQKQVATELFTGLMENSTKQEKDALRSLTSMFGMQVAKAAAPVVKGVVKKGATELVEQAPKVGRAVKESASAVGDFLDKGKKSLFNRNSKNIDDVILQADEALNAAPKTPSEILGAAKEAAPKVSIREKWAGVRPDIKKRIAGKSDKLQEYFDVANARNLDDTLPSALEHGAKQTGAARDALKGVLNDTGGEIGKFRESISKQAIPDGGMVEVRNSFVDELSKLSLTTNNEGQIVRMGNKVTKASDSEVKLLQSLFDDMQTVRGTQTMENLIDLRNALDNRINFAKSAKEASNVVDPLSRSVRAKIRDVNLGAIGADQAKLLDDYSDMIGLLNELNGFVDSKSGGEFLLKRVLSERGRVPREVMAKLKEYTGIDLMDDAVMAQLATDIIGNPAQKGLFQQEITKAGLNVTDIIGLASGRPGAGLGAVNQLLQKGKEAVSPVQDMFLKAAKSNIKP